MELKPKRKPTGQFFSRIAGAIGAAVKRAEARVETLVKNRRIKLRHKRLQAAGLEAVPAPKKRFVRPLILAADALLLLAVVGSAIFLIIAASSDGGRLDVTLDADGVRQVYNVAPSTVKEFLDEAGLELKEEDEVTPPLSSELEAGAVVTVTRAFPVAVASGDTVTLLNVTSGTVGSALEMANIDYTVNDETTHMLFEDLEAGMQIRHTSVEIQYDTIYKTLFYDEKTEKDSSMYRGQSEIVQEGRNGERQVTQRVVVKDGREVSREIVDQVITRPTVDEIIRIGTKIRYQTNRAGEWREYIEPIKSADDPRVKEVMYVEATAYYTGDRTAKGTRPRLGTIAVNPRCIPYYSWIYVPNYGFGQALDTGAFRNYEDGYKNQIDLYMNSSSECRRWGRKRKYKIYILKSKPKGWAGQHVDDFR